MSTNKSLKKSRTFLLTKTPSMAYPGGGHHEKKHQSPPYPRSPQLIFGEEKTHFSHPQHPLSLLNLPDRFTCAGCKEYGAGKRFVCQQCDFQLHDFCGSAPPSLKAHPLHCQHQLVLFCKPVKGGGIVQYSKCDVCNKAIKGYAFRCSACSFQMHPCCAMLNSEMKMSSVHPHMLRLLPANNNINDMNMLCGECTRKRSGRVYHCTVCDYHLHAVCAKNIVNGLRENGYKGNDKPNMLGTAARVASQVVMEFIGGLIEGLAEGVGQVIVQDVAKSRSTTSNTITTSTGASTSTGARRSPRKINERN